MESIRTISKNLMKDVQVIMDKSKEEIVVKDSPWPGFGKILSPEEIEAENIFLEDDNPSNEKIKKAKASDMNGNSEDELEDDDKSEEDDDESEKKPSMKPLKKTIMKPLKKTSNKNIKLSGGKEKIDVNPKLSDLPEIFREKI